MKQLTFEGKSRLDVLEYLIEQVSETYPQHLTLQQLSNDTGIPRTNLHKWLARQVNPRESTYRAAVEALEELLEERKGLPQGTVQNASAELKKISQPVLPNKHDPNVPVFTLTKAEIRILISILVGSVFGSLTTLFFLTL